MYKRTPRVAWNDQKKSAIKRGVGWDFTFESWSQWWETNLGPDWFILRGHHTGQYVMARNGDKGPYTRGNVRCVRVEDNHNEYNLTKSEQTGRPHRKRLDAKTVASIYQATGFYEEIALQYNLPTHIVHRIKCQKAYKTITDRLVKGGSY